ncbi:MAG: HRDC domain-containing protein, partial [Deltaproteobacteria bacterium]|nr:HRDC domain-containing protein [Deltaproteobacteria bacterium]
GYLSVDMEGYGGLRFTEKSKEILKGDQKVFLRKDPEKTKKKKSFSISTNAKETDLSQALVDPQLFEALRACRLGIAQKLKLPPYMIFHDSTLKEMTRHRPQNLETLRQISGVGDHKLKEYGEAFLEVLKSFQTPPHT